MPIHVITGSNPLPKAGVRFQISFKTDENNKTGVRFFLKPFTDADGMATINTLLAVSEDGEIEDLKLCYLKMMHKALQHGYYEIIIPLFPVPPYANISTREILYAASRAYSEIDEDIDLYLLAAPEGVPSTEEELILDIADYISDTIKELKAIEEDRVCYSADDDDIDYSADNDGMRYSADDIEFENQSITLESRTPLRFDPIRGFFQLDESFGETVLKLIEAKGMTEAQCYNRANMSRAAFYKIRQSARDPKSTYRPTKQTAQALAIALELSIDEAEDLLERAGYAFSHSNKGDIIVEYFLVNKIYDIFAVNEALYHYDQPLLGSV